MRLLSLMAGSRGLRTAAVVLVSLVEVVDPHAARAAAVLVQPLLVRKTRMLVIRTSAGHLVSGAAVAVVLPVRVEHSRVGSLLVVAVGFLALAHQGFLLGEELGRLQGLAAEALLHPEASCLA